MKSIKAVPLLVASSIVSLCPVSGADDTTRIVIPIERPQRDLTLVASPSSLSPSESELARLKARVLKADQDAARARIAAIEARIRQIQEEGEARIKELSAERESLIVREREIGEKLKDARL